MSYQRNHTSLVVLESSPVIRRLLKSRLELDGFQVHVPPNSEEGLKQIESLLPSLVIVDVKMPGIDGFEVLRRLKRTTATKMIPVILLTAKADTEERVRGFEAGAHDFVSKPFDPVELRARVRAAVRMSKLVELIEQKAQIDGLTGLSNRGHFDVRLAEEFARARRYRNPMSIVLFDIDFFKKLNDNYGHAFGDIVLQEVAEVTRETARNTDLAARYGGEEFVVILPEQDMVGARIFAERLRINLEALRLVYKEAIIPVTASFGVSSFGAAYASQNEMLIAADQALYAAKRSGRNRVCVAPQSDKAPGVATESEPNTSQEQHADNQTKA